MPPIIFCPPALRNIFENYNSLKWINARKSDPNVNQFQIALPRALANFVGKLETTGNCKICNTVVANMSELESFIGAFADKFDTDTVNVIKNTLQVNGFTTRLQIKLISDRNIEMMFQGSDVTLGARNFFSYYIQTLKDESPLGGKVRSSDRADNMEPSNKVGLCFLYYVFIYLLLLCNNLLLPCDNITVNKCCAHCTLVLTVLCSFLHRYYQRYRYKRTN